MWKQQPLLILSMTCCTRKQMLSEFIPNPGFIKEILMVGFIRTKYQETHTWQVLIFFDGAGQTQQLDQPAAVHLQVVDVATGKNLGKATMRTTEKLTQVYTDFKPNKHF